MDCAYFGRVKRLPLASAFVALAIVLGFEWASADTQGPDRPIRLRNALIQTSEKGSTVAGPADRPLDGLFLVQFSGPFQAEWREPLRQAGVELLRYVPEDAFVVRAQATLPAALSALPFVHWVGAYQPEYKIFAGLREIVAKAGAGGSVPVKLLLSPVATAGERAILRRQLAPISSEARWPFGFTLEGTLPLRLLGQVAGSPAVLWIEPAPKFQLLDEVSTKIVAGDDFEVGTRAVTHQLGFDGEGVAVAVADSGLDTGEAATMHLDLAGRVDAFLYYGALTDASDEHSHGTHVAGIVAGDAAVGETDEFGYLYGLGVAPGAHLVAQRIFDGAGNYEPPAASPDLSSAATLTRDALLAGAIIGSNSWGDDVQGRYDISAQEFDALVRDADPRQAFDQPYILEFSAGNAGPGPQTMDSPAVGKNVLATGASQNDRFDFFIYAEGQDAMADFSSRGPCEDGRIKPDIVAPGTWIASLQSAAAGDENAWSPISGNYLYQGGTSQAGPHASGAAAVFVQFYRETVTNATPSPALVKAALIDAAVDMDDESGTGPTPNMDEGWGRVDLTELVGTPRRVEYLDQTVLLRTGEIHERRLIVFSANEPLRITLAYTDVPGLPAALPALVNDLNLEVIAPDGSVYRGNQFEAGESVAGAASSDRLNNVEAVRLATPAPGEYTVRVLARNVPVDARTDTSSLDQDFALVISGDLPLPGVGTLVMDRRAYRAPDTIRLKLIDFDLAGAPAASVRIRSSTETNAELLTLVAVGSAGVFTGSVAVVSGLASGDGLLQVAHGDTIAALYEDASPGVTRQVTARVDFVPPVISAVSVTNQFARMVVKWTTDEPAASAVRFGTNTPPDLTITNAVRVTSHAVALDGLSDGVTYRFSVTSTDEAGNTSTDDNGGTYYAFVAVPAAPVLLVDAYVHGFDDDSIDIPVTEYTAALDATGVGYEIWNVQERGSPPAADLQPYRVVIWRINDSFYDQTTLTTAQQTAIRTYLDGGGGFLMASMEILSRLGDVPFRRDVLKVMEFVTNPSPFETCESCDEDHGVATLIGEEGDPVGNGLVLDLDYSLYPEFEIIGLGPDLADTFKPATNAVAVAIDLASERACGVRFPRTGEDSPGRVVFFSFPLDAVPMEGAVPNNRVHLLRQSLNVLAPGLAGFGTVALDRPAYTIPGLMLAEVADDDLAGSGGVTVTFASDSVPGGVVEVLPETARRGLFRGFVKLIAVGQPTGPGLLPAKHGDQLWVEYFDDSSKALARTAATVDTQIPVISSVASDPFYEEATITWTTSELCDALVQFGEGSPTFPINRTAYQSDYLFSHQVTLQGLRPDTVYRYQVVSRDEAGNVVVDDNQKQFYALRTLKPIRPPWLDRFESGNTGWTTFDGEDSQSTWRMGPPDNGAETQAHSPANAWGSNLDGAPIDYTETFLISPALELSGGNRATLKFWHSYDFTERSAFDLFEIGTVMIVTNTLSAPVPLAEYGEISNGWEPVELDLTPHLGRVVFLVWSYQLLSFDFEEVFARPGWLIDDVEVTVSGLASGTVLVTNNLAQARFSLSGPISRTGGGWQTTFTDAPPGDYVVRWDSVPFYVEPTPQTNTLTAHTALAFGGLYTFPDGNANGMSDLWEQHWFGAVDPARSALTDTDGDGAADAAEFAAGTDPTRSKDRLKLGAVEREADGLLRLNWPGVAGHRYRVLGSTDLAGWTAVSSWLEGEGFDLYYSVSPSAGLLRYFQVEVRP